MNTYDYSMPIKYLEVDTKITIRLKIRKSNSMNHRKLIYYTLAAGYKSIKNVINVLLL